MKDIPEIDQGLYSRQLYVLGQNAMRRLGECDVLISGLGGLGVEVAKNLILAGVRGVTLQDHEVVKHSDLSSQFFVSEVDLGRNRAEASHEKLAALNKYVKVESFGGSLSDSLIMKHRAVLLSDSTLEENLRVGNLCHENSIYFLSTCVAGIFGQIFCDFGRDFAIDDKFDQPPSVAEVAYIVQAKDKGGLVVYLEENKALFAENDFVTFEGVKNLEQVNGCKPVPIKEVIDRQRFIIENVFGLTQDGEGGTVTEVRMPEAIEYRSYGESMSSPKFSSNDACKEELLHVAFQVLKKFQVKHGHLPRPQSEVDASEFVEMGSNLIKELRLEVEMDEDLFKIFSKCSSGSLSPMCSVVGSISAQEIIKAITRKFEPIHQWFYFSACEVLPPNVDELTEDDCAPRGSRYDGQIAIFGSKHQETIMDQKLFLVGVGAIGCEMLKNWAMMGIGSGEKGRVIMTDMDMIEKSNLNRQFLFRPEHIGKMKSVTASEMVRKLMNSNMKVEAYESKVSKETEDVFNDPFFESFDVIVNALDNIPARLYVADKCVYHHKPLLESGTEGTRCHVQVILPGLTCSYSNKGGSDETIPLCTLKYFPSSIEHTIQWARDDFEGCFKLNIKTALDFLMDENFVENTRKLSGNQPVEKLQEVLEVFENFVGNGSQEFKDASNHERCLQWARNKFEKHFNNQIHQLRFNFPPDAKTQKGLPFWSGSKKCPKPIIFDSNEPLHMDYITSAANVLASALGINLCGTREEATKLSASIPVPQFHPSTKIVIPTNDEEAKAQQDNLFDAGEFDELVKKLPDVQLLRNLGLQLRSIDFEKDGEDNFHVDFVTAASNLRAANYGITSVDKLETKRIVGKIIPAISTTTSLVVGLVCLELLKILTGQKNLKKYKNWFCRMSSYFIQRSDVKHARKLKYRDLEFTIWDNFIFEEDVTLEHLIDKLKVEHKVDTEAIYYGKSALLSFLTPCNARKERLKMKVSEVIERIIGPLAPNVHSVHLDILPSVDNDQDIEQFPFVKVKLA